MHVTDKNAGAHMAVLSGGGARGVAAGTGDNTEAVGDIVDSLAISKRYSGAIVITGSAVLADTEGISLNNVCIEHGAVANLSDKADAFTAVDFADVKVSDGGTTELFGIKLNVDLTILKRYWRVTVTPDLSASGTDTFQLGFGVVAVGEEAPLL